MILDYGYVHIDDYDKSLAFVSHQQSLPTAMTDDRAATTRFGHPAHSILNLYEDVNCANLLVGRPRINIKSGLQQMFY